MKQKDNYNHRVYFIFVRNHLFVKPPNGNKINSIVNINTATELRCLWILSHFGAGLWHTHIFSITLSFLCVRLFEWELTKLLHSQ